MVLVEVHTKLKKAAKPQTEIAKSRVQFLVPHRNNFHHLNQN